MTDPEIKPIRLVIRLRRMHEAEMIGIDIVNLDRSHPVECEVHFSDLFTSGQKGPEVIKAAPGSYGHRKLWINEKIILEPT